MTVDVDGADLGARPSRHDLLLVAPACWPEVVADLPPTLSAAQRSEVEHWAGKRRPVVVRRPAPGDPAGAVPVGVPLPPSLGKLRVRLAIPASARRTEREAVDLGQVREVAPPHWRGTVDAVSTLAASLDLRPRVFGALLWQALTGLDYLHAGSDIDLLWPVRDEDKLGRLLAGLSRIDEAGTLRIDGEVLLGAAGVHWRELDAARRGDVALVLAKTMDRVELVPLEALLSSRLLPCS